MTDADAAKLLGIIKWGYPNAYRDISDQDAAAICRLWQMAYADTPYPIMEYALRIHMMRCKYPPTIAEIAGILGHLHSQAQETYYLLRQMDSTDSLEENRKIMDTTARFAADPQMERFLPLMGSDMLCLTDGSATI